MDYLTLYSIIYALAARGGREAALFGPTAPRSQEAFSQSMVEDVFPELWFEMPLMGEPWFDLHALTSRDSLRPDMNFTDQTTGGYPHVFEWFSRQEDARQLALSWDIGSRDATTPAIQLLLKRSNMDVMCEFLEVVGRPDVTDAYRSFIRRMPRDWFACYTGTFPNRPGTAVHVECIPSAGMQDAYAQDPSLLEDHLHQAGITDLGDTLLSRCHLMAQMPFQLEFQFEVLADGSVGSTFGASVRFAPPTLETPRMDSFQEDGAAGKLMELVESWGLADERWHLLQGTSFSKRATRGEESMAIYAFPAFIKLRWREGKPLDAKTYLMAGMH